MEYIKNFISTFFCNISWECISMILSITIDIVLLVFAGWTFKKTFFKNLKFTEYKHSYRFFKPYSLSIGLENNSFVPLSIKELMIVIDDEFYLKILDQHKDNYVKIPGLSSTYITYEYTTTPNDDLNKVLNNGKKFCVIAVLVGGKELVSELICSKSKKTKPLILKKIRTKKEFLNKELLSEDALFIATILNKETKELHTIFINNKGLFNTHFYEIFSMQLEENDTEITVEKKLQDTIDEKSPNKFIVSVKNRILFFAKAKHETTL